MDRETGTLCGLDVICATNVAAQDGAKNRTGPFRWSLCFLQMNFGGSHRSGTLEDGLGFGRTD